MTAWPREEGTVRRPMTAWTLVRFLHLTAVALFVGGQLMLVVAVTPAVRGHQEAMKAVARRFGMASAVALVVLLATGAAMASHYDRWGDSVLKAKLGVLALVGVILGAHIVIPKARGLSLALLAA